MSFRCQGLCARHILTQRLEVLCCNLGTEHQWRLKREVSRLRPALQSAKKCDASLRTGPPRTQHSQYVAPSGTRIISTRRPSFPASVFVRTSTREVSTLFFSFRYFLAPSARSLASFCARRSLGSA